MARLYIKTTSPPVQFKAPGVAMAIAFTIIAKIYNDYGQDCRITSGNDGKHKTGSRHYTDDALDFSIKLIPTDIKNKIVADCKASLPGYDVLHESVGTDNEHLHVEAEAVRGK